MLPPRERGPAQSSMRSGKGKGIEEGRLEGYERAVMAAWREKAEISRWGDMVFGFGTSRWAGGGGLRAYGTERSDEIGGFEGGPTSEKLGAGDNRVDGRGVPENCICIEYFQGKIETNNCCRCL